MARESAASLRQRMLRVIDGLRAAHPDAHCELVHSNPLELLVATILSAQCSDRQVNLVTAELFRKYRSAGDYARVPADDLAEDIRRLGLFRSKARNLQAAARLLINEHHGEVPRTLGELTRLPGVGRKTANVVLGNAFGLTSGIVVDTHVARLAGRLRFTAETDPVKIETELMRLVPAEHWTMFSHWLIWHGRRRCSARSPDCAGCEIRGECPSADGPVSSMKSRRQDGANTRMTARRPSDSALPTRVRVPRPAPSP